MTDTSAAESSSLETREEATAIGGEAKFWQGQLAIAEADHRDWIKNGKSIVQRFKGEKEKLVRGNKRFNILYSNTETLKAALFARMAKPDIRRRFADKDPIGKQVAEIVERASIYCDDSYDADKEFERGIEDYLLPGRGVVRVCYEAETGKDDQGKDQVTKQELYDKYWPWDDFRHEAAKVWGDVTWIAYRHRMSRKALRDNFQKGSHPQATLTKEEVDAIPLNWTPKAEDDKLPDAYKRAEVWEVWDLETRTRVWVVDGYPELCRKDPDPYGLADFFDITEPLQAITANDTVIPRPEFESYRDQADGLDEIEGRIDRLTRALKRRGVRDATIPELAQLAKAADNQFIPVKNYADLTTKGGLAAAFQSEDLTIIAKVLTELHGQRDLRVQTIYEVVGIADIMRGSSDPRETLGAQKIKAQFGGNRLKKRQDKVQKWIRNTLRLKAEIIAEHFEPQKLAEMTGFKWEPIPPQAPGISSVMPMASMPNAGGMASPSPAGMPALGGMQPGALQQGIPQPAEPPSVDNKITPEMIAVLRNDKLRSYRIDIETDSTVFEDAEAEKQGRVEILKAIGEFVTAWFPIIQANPKLLPLAFEMLSFGVRGFKAGRQLEESIEQAKMQLEEAAKVPPPPSPEDKKIEADKQAMAAKLQADLQKQQGDLQVQQDKLQMEQQANAQKLQFEQQKHEQEMAFEAQKHQAEMVMKEREMAMHAQERQQELEMRDKEMQQTSMENESNRRMQSDQHSQMMAQKSEEMDRNERMETTKLADAKVARREELKLKTRQTEDGGEETVSSEEVMAENTNKVMKEVSEALQALAKAQTAKRKIVRGADGKASHTEAVL